jgi:hypothetical protein
MYDKETELENVLKAISDEAICFFEDIELYVGPSKRAMQLWGFHELPAIKDALAKNKVRRKVKMRRKWEDSDNAALQIAAYKLIAEPEEIERITMSKVTSELTGKDGQAIQTENKLTVEIVKTTDYQTK